ncbi:MAG: amidase [Myxococcales bacterium]|nr:amidase [Myxococcales bacterium]
MPLEAFASLDATAQADLVREKEVTPLELVDAAIARIETFNPVLNAVVLERFDEARRAARGRLPEGPFAGVPTLIKDILASVAGWPTTSGSRYLRDFVPREDSELVARLRRAGFVFLGKTNTPEFGYLPTTEPRFFGATRNPWDTRRSTGGSSGGAAAAVATRMGPVAHASDGGGSIRIPASCCGLFGLKPSRGRVSLGPELGDIMSGLVCEHVLTVSVRDSAGVLDVLAGPALGDPYYAPPPAQPFVTALGGARPRLRIAVWGRTLSGGEVHEDVGRALADAADLCRALGHDVREAAPELDYALLNQAFTAVWVAGAAMTMQMYPRILGREPGPDDIEPFSRTLAELGQAESAATYLGSIVILQRMTRAVARFMQDWDVILTPTLAAPPPLLGAFEPTADNPFLPFLRSAELAAFTPLQNATGQPAMNVPLHWSAAGLPIGVQFVGRYAEEATLLALGAALEEARPWAGRRPPSAA